MFNKKVLKGLTVAALVASVSLAGLNALTVDKSSVKVIFDGYKTEKKTKVDGTFKTITTTFQKESGSVADILNGAVGVIDLKSVDTKLAARNKNIVTKFFDHLKQEKLKGTFKAASGDDKKGKVTLELDFNGVKKDIPMTYENKGGQLIAKGTINVNDFAKEEFEKFSMDKTIQGLHGKKTWETVDITFSASVK